jgi:hypothetical protein
MIEPGELPRAAWGDTSVAKIWEGIRLEIAYRTGLDPDLVDWRMMNDLPAKYPAGDWDSLLEPVVLRIMRDLGFIDTR